MPRKGTHRYIYIFDIPNPDLWRDGRIFNYPFWQDSGGLLACEIDNTGTKSNHAHENEKHEFATAKIIFLRLFRSHTLRDFISTASSTISTHGSPRCFSNHLLFARFAEYLENKMTRKHMYVVEPRILREWKGIAIVSPRRKRRGIMPCELQSVA